MKPNDLHQTIAQQVDHMKPEHYVPGRDVGMEVIDADTLRVVVLPTQTSIEIRYDHGPDTYTVTRCAMGAGAIPDTPLSDIYCDQLGEMCFGDEAKSWTQKFGHIADFDGNIITEF